MTKARENTGLRRSAYMVLASAVMISNL